MNMVMYKAVQLFFKEKRKKKRKRKENYNAIKLNLANSEIKVDDHNLK